MRISKLFTKTLREAPKDETSKNAQFLTRAGFIFKEMAGVYTYLPLGLIVLEKIKNIIREELDSAGCQELKMTTLQKKENWEKTGRWNDEEVDIWFKTKLKNDTELGLAFTHEEPLTNIVKNFVSSYKDLPSYIYQFQTKFRNELRAKAGIIRGREFLMKDLYDFSLSEKDHKDFYEKMKEVYMNIFNKVGIGENTYLTMSSGGSFSKYSFEFQAITEAGEDTILYDKKKKIAINKADYSEEIFEDFGLKKEDYNFEEAKAIEVGDIYTLGEKYSKAVGFSYKDSEGKDRNVFMGSYGIGVSRLMGAIVEMFNDDKGIIWPESVAPFAVHLVQLGDNEKAKKGAKDLYKELEEKGVEVLYDDREDVAAGEKFADADLIGVPYRVVISEKTVDAGKIEVKKRSEDKVEMLSKEEFLSKLI